MKIKTKFLGIICIFIVLFGISILGLSFYLHTQTSKAINNILEYRNELEIISQLELALTKTIMPANDYIIHGNEAEKYTFENLDASVGKHFSMLEEKHFHTSNTMEGRKILDKLKSQYFQIKAFSGKIFNLPNPIGNVEGAHLMEKMDLLMDNMLDDMKELHKHSRWDVLVEVEVINAYFHRYMIIMLSVLGVIIIVSLFYGLFLTRGIIKPIERLVEYMRFVAKGDFSRKADIKTNDEIGLLSSSFNKMTEDLQKTTVSKNYVDNIIKSMTDTLIVVTPDAKTQSANKSLCNLLGYKEEELLGRSIGMIFEENLIFNRTSTGKVDIKNSITNMENTYLSKDGRKVPVLFSNSILRDNEGEIQGIVCTALDITEQKQNERLLQESETKYRQIHANSFDGIIIADIKGKITEVNPSAEKMFGYKEGKMVGLDIVKLMPERYRKKHLAGMEKLLKTNKSKYLGTLLEFEGLRENGETFSLELIINSFSVNRSTYFTGTIRDVTKHKKEQEQIKASIQEKEILLREVYHRTKNNMQVICSLFNLQSQYTKDEKVLNIFRETVNRIKSMSLVHTKLYKSKDLSNINLKSYVEDLALGLYKAYQIGPNKILLKLLANDIFTTIDTAIPCGLVINEILTNSIKYAFPDNRKGEIRIELYLSDKGEIELKIADNGIGMPKDFDFKNAKTLGAQLVFSLVEHQLQGKVDLSLRKGVEFQIKFRDADHLKRI